MAEQSMEEMKEAFVDLDAEIRELLCVKKAFKDSNGNEYDRIADALKDYEVETRLLEDGIHVELRNRVNFRMYRQVFDHKALVEYRFESSWDISTMLTMVEAAIKGTEQEHVCLELAYVKWTPAAGPGHPGEVDDSVQFMGDGDVYLDDEENEDLSAMAAPTTHTRGAERFVDSEAFSDYYTEGDALVLRLLEKSRFKTRTYFLIIEEKPQRVYQRHGIVIERVQQKLELLAKLLIDDRQKTTDKTARVDSFNGRCDRIEGEIAKLSETSAAPSKDAAKVSEDLAKKSQGRCDRIEGEIAKLSKALAAHCKDAAKVSEDLAKKSQGRCDRIEREIAKLSKALAAPCKDAAKVSEDLAKKSQSRCDRIEGEIAKLSAASAAHCKDAAKVSEDLAKKIQSRCDRIKGEIAKLSAALAAHCKDAAKVSEDLAKKSQGRCDRIEGEIAKLSKASAAHCKDAAKVAEDLAKINNSLVTPSAIACLQSPTKNGEFRLWNATKYMATLATDWIEVIDNGERIEVKLAAVFRVEVTVTSTGNTNISCAIQVNDNVMAQTRAVLQDAGHCQSLSVCWVQSLNIGDKIRIHAPFSVDELISNTLIVRML